MKLSQINVVIADDDIFKGHDIRRALEFNGIRRITIVRDQEKLWEKMKQTDEKIDLIVSDMQYPLKAGAGVEEEAGLKLLERMKAEKINIPVIICSSANYDIPGTLGCVWYSEQNDLNFNFRELLARLEL